jgi:hypothetical protein
MSARRILSIAEALPLGWLDHLTENGRLGSGLDIATTEKATSNPSALSIIEEVGLMYFIRLLVRWKTNDPEVTKALIRYVISSLSLRRRRLNKLCVDATNERFFATDLRSDLAGEVPVELIISSEAITYRGEKMPTKTYLGNLYVNTIDEGRMALPEEKWISDDARQVVRDRGGFDAAVDKQGNHADGFDAVKLGLHSLIGRGGPASASAASVGSLNPGNPSSYWQNPFAHLFDTNRRSVHA